MQRIKGYEPGGGSAEADAALEGVRRMLDFVPNFHKVLALSPAAITAFAGMRETLQGTKLRAVEREVIAVEVSRIMACPYCLAAHSKFLRLHKVAEDDIRALREGRPMGDPRLALVQGATRRLWESKGDLSEGALAELRTAGLDDAALMEVISIIGWYVWATMVNNLAHTEIDPFFRA